MSLLLEFGSSGIQVPELEGVRQEEREAGVESLAAIAAAPSTTEAEPFQQHRDGLLNGTLDAYHSGSPCNYFSVVRLRPGPARTKPVRGREHSYGFPGDPPVSARTRSAASASYKTSKDDPYACEILHHMRAHQHLERRALSQLDAVTRDHRQAAIEWLLEAAHAEAPG